MSGDDGQLLITIATIVFFALRNYLVQRGAGNVERYEKRVLNGSLTGGNGATLAARSVVSSQEFLQEQFLLLQRAVALQDVRMNAIEARLTDIEQVARQAPRDYETYTQHVTASMLTLMREEFNTLRRELKP